MKLAKAILYDGLIKTETKDKWEPMNDIKDPDKSIWIVTEGGGPTEDTYKHGSVKKALRVAYLEGILKYNIWADSYPGGNKLCDEYKKELENLVVGK